MCTYGGVTIPKFIDKKKRYTLKLTVMNKTIKDLYEKPQDAKKGLIKVRQDISIISYASYLDFSKDKSKLIEMMCRYYSVTKDIKANNYQNYARKFN